MCKINFVNEGIEIEVEAGTTIEKAARSCGVFIETPCAGIGKCGKCRVKIRAVGREDAAQDHTAEKEVLACQTRVTQDLMVYTQNSEAQNKNMQILSTGTVLNVEMKNDVEKKYDSSTDQTQVFRSGEPVGKENGDTTGLLYGVTVDIGTTTLVAALLDCNTGEEIDDMSAINPQCTYAQDVVSRINFTSNTQNGLKILFESVRDEINRMIASLCDKNGINKKNIYEVVYSGNTTMVHLATNTDPYTLGRYPYTPVITGGSSRPAAEYGLHISEYGRVYIPPIISSYVGSDITSGVLSAELDATEKNILFIDIGTNGEMILCSNGRMTACSTAAGPAFEGMNITFGMRASSGAVEYFDITEAGIDVRTIGAVPATGICGSGLFDITGELVRIGVIEKNGRFIKPEKSAHPDDIKERITKYEGKAAFRVTEQVYLTQADIRQIQLAKSAIRAGIEAMLGLNQVEIDQLDGVYIAGSFGYHLRAKSLVNIGIIPAELENRIAFIGNTSKTGGNAFLINTDVRSRMSDAVKEIQALELSDYPGFEDMFIQQMSF